jgi:hypothetical protein
MCGKRLRRYRELINRLRVDQQTSISSIDTWTDRLGPKVLEDLLLSLNQTHRREGNGTIEISRGDLFQLAKREKGISRRLIYSVYIWGYPSGGRGNNCANMASRIEQIERAFLDARNPMCRVELDELSARLHGCGIGLSTWTKLLYFGGFRVGSYHALILDSKVIRTFQRRLFEEFDELNRIGITYNNGAAHYETYLRVMSRVASGLRVDRDKLEMFVFLFGSSLKSNCR